MSKEITTTTYGTTSTLPTEMQTKMKKEQYPFTNSFPKLTQASPKRTKWKESQPPISAFTLREGAAAKGQTADTTTEYRLNQIY